MVVESKEVGSQLVFGVAANVILVCFDLIGGIFNGG